MLRSRDSHGSGTLMGRVALLEIPTSVSMRISLGEILKARTLVYSSWSEMSEICCLLSVMAGNFLLLLIWN